MTYEIVHNACGNTIKETRNFVRESLRKTTGIGHLGPMKGEEERVLTS